MGVFPNPHIFLPDDPVEPPISPSSEVMHHNDTDTRIRTVRRAGMASGLMGGGGMAGGWSSADPHISHGHDEPCDDDDDEWYESLPW